MCEEKRVREMFSWSRKLSFRGLLHPISTPKRARHSASLAASVIIHAQQAVDLDLGRIIATDEVLSAIAGSASSLTNLRVTFDLRTLSAGALVSVGALVNLRSFKIFVHREWGALSSNSIHEWAAWDLPHLTHLGLHMTQSRGPNLVAFVRFLCRCRLPCLSFFHLGSPGISLNDSHVVAEFFRKYCSLRQCTVEITARHDIAILLPHVSSTYLRLSDFAVYFPHVDLQSRVRTLVIEYTVCLLVDHDEVSEEEEFFSAFDTFNAHDYARNGLAHLQLCISTYLHSKSGVHCETLPFRWLNPNQDNTAFVERTRPYALRLRASGIELLDSDGLTVEGIRVEVDDATWGVGRT
jgi:hypothetical protein